MRVAVIGAGRVGLATALALDHVGHIVACVDIDENHVAGLRKRVAPFVEPGLEHLLAITSVHFISGMTSEQANSDVVIVAVPTPGLQDGQADVSAVRAVAQTTADLLTDGQQVIFAIKSTVPPGTTDDIQKQFDQTSAKPDGSRVWVVANPEFLRGGSSIADTLHPDRIVIGTSQGPAGGRLLELYRPIVNQAFSPVPGISSTNGYQRVPTVVTNSVNAELIKYGSNAFLATKLSFVNELAGLAERVGGDVTEIVKGMGLDPRIGSSYMEAGIGWGGPCLGKDTAALLRLAESYNYTMPVLQSAIEINQRQRQEVVAKLEKALGTLRGATVGILGLAYKPGTDDITDSPAIAIASRLIGAGARVRGYDPCVRALSADAGTNIARCSTIEDLAQDCDALILISRCSLPLEQLHQNMRRPVLADVNNLLNTEEVVKAGFIYIGLGR